MNATVLRAFGALVVGVLVSFGLAGPASAHNDLVASDPQSGAMLQEPPSTLTFTFSEDVAPELATITVRVGSQKPTILSSHASGVKVMARVPGRLAVSGTWKVAYRVVSADGHPVEGQLAFTVKAAPTPTQTPTAGPAEVLDEETPPLPGNDSDNTEPWVSVLVLGVLVALPVAVFVVAANARRRQQAEPKNQ